MIPETVLKRVRMLHSSLQQYKDNPNAIPDDTRQEFSFMFSVAFKEFTHFAELGMQFLGFKISKLQLDIAEYMQYGGKKIMVQAQRGQAKSTLAALYCIWLEMQDPTTRILVVSGGGGQADDVAILVKRIIMSWSLLCWMRPDISKGDRDSAVKFDLHCSIKGIDKSPSITSCGITAALTGKRADFILGDDIETPKNSYTQPMREQLAQRTTEFAAICISGRIMYLGTPQTKDSVYKNLPQRGYGVRIWTGRYPTQKELERYAAGTEIAPIIMDAIKADPSLQYGGGIDGTRGQPTDPLHISEEIHQEKELDYGAEGYTLQYMLDTSLADARRTKIKLADFIVYGGNSDKAPETLYHSQDPAKMITNMQTINPCIASAQMFHAASVTPEMTDYCHKLMTIDPAGCGGDEISYASGGATKGFIHLFSFGGLTGGFTEENINTLLVHALSRGIKAIHIERNTGAGAVTALIRNQIEKLVLILNQNERDPIIERFLIDTGLKPYELRTALRNLGITDFFSTTQKERRIIDTISPITRKHKLVIHLSAIEDDYSSCLQYTPDKRSQYSGLFQLMNITYDRGCLVHDDRADTIQALVQELTGFLAQDDRKASEQRAEKDFQEWLRNPMGLPKNAVNLNSGASKGIKLNTSRRGKRI